MNGGTTGRTGSDVIMADGDCDKCLEGILDAVTVG